MSDSFSDPYKIYKLIRQRANRSLCDDVKLEMAELARRIVLTLYRNRREIKPGTAIFEQIDQDLEALIAMESALAFRVSLARRMQKVIRGGAFPLAIPYHVLPLWQDHSQTNGTVYVLSSPDYPGHCKIGATSMDVDKRISIFSRRYQVPVTVVYQRNSFDPFWVERKVARTFSEFRVRANTFGTSNEWYRIDWKFVTDTIDEYSISVPLIN